MKWQNLSKGMFTVVRKWKGLLRLDWDNTTKLKRKQHKSFCLIETA